DGPDRSLPPPQLRARRGRGRVRLVDDHAEERAVIDDVREEAELIRDAGELTGEPWHAERGLRVGGSDQLRRTGLDAVGGGAQQRRALRTVSERIEGRTGSADRRVHGG